MRAILTACILILLNTACLADEIAVAKVLTVQSPYTSYKSRVIDKPEHGFYALDIIKGRLSDAPLFSVEVVTEGPLWKEVDQSASFEAFWSQYIKRYFKQNFGNGGYSLAREVPISLGGRDVTVYIGQGKHNGGKPGSIYAVALAIGRSSVVLYSLQEPIELPRGEVSQFPNWASFVSFVQSAKPLPP